LALNKSREQNASGDRLAPQVDSSRGLGGDQRNPAEEERSGCVCGEEKRVSAWPAGHSKESSEMV